MRLAYNRKRVTLLHFLYKPTSVRDNVFEQIGILVYVLSIESDPSANNKTDGIY